MPSAVGSNQRPGSPGRKESTNYDQDADDFMRDLDFNTDQPDIDIQPQDQQKDIDEEVQIKKKRKPNPKLDEARLLSHSGVPKLRKLAKSKLKFRGKGHEYCDISTLLNMYQLWLDDMYPKAKFKDGLAMVEKVGHTKRMQITRKAWLDAAKPHRRQDSPERLGDFEMSGGLGDVDGGEVEGTRNGEPNANSMPQSISSGRVHGDDDHAPEDDELDALLAEQDTSTQGPRQGGQRSAKGPFEEDSDPEGDELDALMAEHESAAAATSVSRNVVANKAPQHGNAREDDFADEEEAMAGMDW